jgi:ABC-type nitrate/sulfonate/bicarbonate transport system substrate-binding protein
MKALMRIGLAAFAACLASGAFAQGAPEKAKVVLGVGGKPALYYLPLTIAERKGFFKEEGLEVEINDFAGGARALQALVGGSVDVVTGAYEHTVRMQAKGQDVRGVAELGRFPSITVAVRKEHAGTVKSAADFKGKKIGVTAPGSSTYLIPLYAMSKAGLKASDASFIGVGATASAVAAIQRGEIDIISNTEPVISKLEQEGAIVPLIHTRTEAGALRRLEPGRDALYAGGVHREESRDDAAPGQRLHEVVEMAAGGDARGGGRYRAARVPFGGQGALRRCGEEVARELFARRHRVDGRHEQRARHAESARSRDAERDGRRGEDVR